MHWPYPKIIIHRGAGKKAPENTLAAVRLGATLGYKMAEVDVKLTGDGVTFLLHDETLERTTNGKGRADAYTWSALARLDAGMTGIYAGEPPCSLVNLAQFCRANEYLINLEIKPMPGRERETGAAVALDAKSYWENAAVSPLLSSFSYIALQAAQEVAPELPRVLLCEILPDNWQMQVQELALSGLDIHHSQIDQALVDAVHAVGIKLIAWTVNDPIRVQELLSFGVDSIITDEILSE